MFGDVLTIGAASRGVCSRVPPAAQHACFRACRALILTAPSVPKPVEVSEHTGRLTTVPRIVLAQDWGADLSSPRSAKPRGTPSGAPRSLARRSAASKSQPVHHDSLAATTGHPSNLPPSARQPSASCSSKASSPTAASSRTGAQQHQRRRRRRVRVRHRGAHLKSPQRAKPRGRPQAPDTCTSLTSVTRTTSILAHRQPSAKGHAAPQHNNAKQMTPHRAEKTVTALRAALKPRPRQEPCSHPQQRPTDRCRPYAPQVLGLPAVAPEASRGLLRRLA
jgi:hypothetical protein